MGMKATGEKEERKGVEWAITSVSELSGGLNG